MRTRPRWWISVAQSVVLLPVVRLMLWALGYRRTVGLLSDRLLSGGVSGHGIAPSVDVPDDVREISSAVTALSRFAPFRSRCLARSITIWWLSRRRGHDVDVMIGVAPPVGKRLRAHAWGEYGGVVLNDTSDVRSRYPMVYSS